MPCRKDINGKQENAMKQYRIKQLQDGNFAVQQRYMFWWVDITSPRTALQKRMYYPITSVQEAQKRIDMLNYKDRMIPVIYI
jgi:hypothetical protein